MTTQPFDITKCKRSEDGHLVAQYRNGEPAIILTTKAYGEYPIITMGSAGEARTHTRQGCLSKYTIGAYDLINIPEKRTIEFWLRVYKDGGIYSTTEKPDIVSVTAIACLHIIREYTEGEGL